MNKEKKLRIEIMDRMFRKGEIMRGGRKKNRIDGRAVLR